MPIRLAIRTRNERADLVSARQRVMTGVQILLLVVVLLIVIAGMTALWVRRQRTGGVLIADTATAPTGHDGSRR